MPIFAYHCEACGKDFETLVRADESATCPACESADVTRQLSLIARPNAGGPDGGSAYSAAEAPACAGGACGFGGGCS